MDGVGAVGAVLAGVVGSIARKAPEYLKKLAVLNFHLSNDINMANGGGESGIRTHGTRKRTTVFEAASVVSGRCLSI